MKKIISLNEVYEANELAYRCNAIGEIIDLNSDPKNYHITEPDILPARERELYDTFWNETAVFTSYVVDYRNTPGMAFCFRFGGEWRNGFETTDEALPALLTAIREETELLANSEKYAACTFMIGDGTDPEGHELLVYVPYEERHLLGQIEKDLTDENLYTRVEERFMGMHPVEKTRIYALVVTSDQSDFCDNEYNNAEPAFDRIEMVSFDLAKLQKRKAELEAEDAKDREELDTDPMFFEIVELMTEMPRVAIQLDGGLVQEVLSDAPVSVEVIDLDSPDFPDEAEMKESDAKAERWQELENDTAMKNVLWT